MSNYDSDCQSADETLELIEDIKDNYNRLWDKCEDFMCDVRSQVKAVRKSAEEYGNFTTNQAKAIQSWNSAVKKWHPDYKD